MDYSKFPRQRGYPPSHTGERQARFLDTLGAPALHRRNPDGSVSHKQGDRLWVEPGDQQQPDGFYSLGVVAGRTHVFASPTASGTFLDRGAFMGDDGLMPWSVNRLYHQQRGWGLAVASERYGSAADFNGYPTHTHKMTLARTRNGRQFDVVGEYLFALGWDGWNFTALFDLCTPTRLLDGSELLAGFAAVAVSLAGDYVPVYLLNDVTPVILPTRTYQVVHDFAADTLAPRMRLGQVHYTRAIYPQLPIHAGDPPPVPHAQNNALNPGLDIYFSNDGGANWAWAGPQSAFAEFTATAVPMDVPPDVAAAGLWTQLHVDINTLFNQVATATRVVGKACPVSARYALALASVGYVVADPTAASGWKARRKYRVVAIDNQAGTITEAALLLDAGLDESNGYVGSAVAISGGMLFQLKPRTTPDFHDGPVQCWFMAWGGAPVLMGTLPTPAWLTGSLFAIDRNTVGCALYINGAYQIYQTRDLGATWTQRALIARAALPAQIPEANYLIDFEYVAQLLNHGAAANPMPGAPWACDERMEAPAL